MELAQKLGVYAVYNTSPTKWLSYTASCQSSARIGKARRQDRRSDHYATPHLGVQGPMHFNEDIARLHSSQGIDTTIDTGNGSVVAKTSGIL